MLRISVNGLRCRSLVKLNFTQDNTRRSLHVICRTRHNTLKNSRIFNSYSLDSHSLSAFFIRHASTTDAPVDFTKEQPLYRIDLTGKDQDLPPIPDVPNPISDVLEVIPKIHPNGEIAFESIGLGGYWPPGLIQSGLEWLHVSFNLPWWGSIAAVTLMIRLLMFPIIIKNQRHSAILAKYMPQMQQLQQKLMEARMSGNEYEAAVHAQKLFAFTKEHGLSPLKPLVTMVLVQFPVFCSFYMALKGMVNLPVESLKTGGLWWFTDLTIPDPYFLLPLITSATLLVTIEVGTDTAGAEALGKMKYVLRAVPIILIPASICFPSAILCYWTISNFVSLGQAAVLKIPSVRTVLKLPERVIHKPQTTAPKKGFVKGLKDSWDNMKVAKQLADRESSDLRQFIDAGRMPVIKTYKYDPTKQTKASTELNKKL